MSPSIRLLFLMVLPYSSYVVGSAIMIYPSYEIHQLPLVPPYTNAQYTPFGNLPQQRSESQILTNRNTFSNNGAVHPIGNMNNNEETNRVHNRWNGGDVDKYRHSRIPDAQENSAKILHRNSEYEMQQPNYPPLPPSDHLAEPKDAQGPSTKITFQNPDLTNLLKPITIKATSTSNGVMDLVTAFLTSSSTGNLQMKGFTDLVINGIIKPLLVAKGGIKTLISKLTIPLISLLLINLEVLVTVWWLWEDCPQPKYQPPTYPYPEQSYNNYNMSYR